MSRYHTHECCLCLLTQQDDENKSISQYGSLWCCDGCLNAAVAVAYFAACRIGYAKKNTSSGLDICECGDYRKSHDNGVGICRTCVSGTTSKPHVGCKEFRFAHRGENG